MRKFKKDSNIRKFNGASMLYRDMLISIKDRDDVLYVNIVRENGASVSSKSLACKHVNLDGFNINKDELQELVTSLADTTQKKLCKLLDSQITEKEYRKYKDFYYKCDKIVQPYLYL